MKVFLKPHAFLLNRWKHEERRSNKESEESVMKDIYISGKKQFLKIRFLFLCNSSFASASFRLRKNRGLF
jgi:hypothetical protein